MKKLIILTTFISFLLTNSAFTFAATKEKKKEKPLTNAAVMALQKAQEFQEKDEFQKACDTINKFLTKHKKEDHHYIEYLLGALYLEMDKPKKALTAFENSVKLEDSFCPSWQNIGKIAYDFKDYKKAASALEKAYNLSEKKNKNLLFAAAMAYRNDKNLPKAFELLNIVTTPPSKNKNHVNAYVHTGITLKKHKTVLKRLKKLIDLNKEPYLMKLAANTALSINDYKTGVNYLTIYAMSSEKTSFRDDKLTGDLYRALQTPFKSIPYYEKALKKKENLKVYKSLSSSLIESNLNKKALKTIQKGLVKYPKSYELWKLKAFIHYENEEFSRAFTAVAKSLQFKNKDKNSTILLAYCAGKSGRVKEAKKIISKIKVKKKSKKEALKILAGFEQMEN